LRGVDLIEPEGEMRKTVAFVYQKVLNMVKRKMVKWKKKKIVSTMTMLV